MANKYIATNDEIHVALKQDTRDLENGIDTSGEFAASLVDGHKAGAAATAQLFGTDTLFALGISFGLRIAENRTAGNVSDLTNLS